MELKTSVTSVKFSKEEKNLCKQMCDFLCNISDVLDSSNKDLLDYYGSSWDRGTLGLFCDFCDRVMNLDNKNEDEWELE